MDYRMKVSGELLAQGEGNGDIRRYLPFAIPIGDPGPPVETLPVRWEIRKLTPKLVWPDGTEEEASAYGT